MARIDSSVETPIPQIRVPTRLVTRYSGQTLEARVIAPGVAPLLRVGPYEVVRVLVRAPYAWLAEARGPSGEAVLLQLAHLRAVHGQVDLQHRQHLEKAIAKATAELFSETEFTIMAHGGADRDDGSRALFWALPWRPDAERTANAALYVEGPAHLVQIAIALTQRVARRHVIGRLEPLLSEHLVLVVPEGAELCGVPIQVPPAWLASGSPVARLAPEESMTEEPTKLGDIWRLGQTLFAMSSPFDALPRPFAELLERMISPDANHRPPRATEVLVELEAIHHGLDRGLALVRVESSRTNVLDALSPDSLGEILVRCLGESTKVDLLQPFTEELPLSHFTPAPATERVQLPTPPAVPPWAFFFSPAELGEFLKLIAEDLAARGLEGTIGTGVVQLSGQGWPAFKYLGLSELARNCHRGERSAWRRLIARDFDALLAEANTLDPRFAPTAIRSDSALAIISRPRKTPLPELGPTTFEPDTTLDTPAIERSPAPVEEDPSRIILGQRMDPVGPQDFNERRPVYVAAFKDRPGEATLIDGTGAGPLDASTEAAARNRLTAFTVRALAALALIGLVLGIARVVVPKADVANYTGEMTIEASPPGAIVISERDGRILGTVPQRFLMPRGARASVLITADGYQPQRLDLPDHGRLIVELERLPEAIDKCALAVDADAQGAYEGVAARIDSGARLVVRGAAVVRAKAGATHEGAWIVKCPKLGGSGEVALEQPPIPTVELSVVSPPIAEVSIDGGRVGIVPATTKVRGAFVEVQVTTAEGERVVRWVPALTKTEVHMPSAHHPSSLLGLGASR